MVLSEGDIEKIKGIFTDRFLNSIAERVTQILDKKYNARLKEQEQRIALMEQEIKNLRESKQEMQNCIDSQEQAHRNLNIRMFGIPAENNENLRTKILDIFKRMKIDNINNSHIKKCHRVVSKIPTDKPPAVLVRFNSDTERTAVLKNRKYLKSTGVQIKEDLTKTRLTLLTSATEKYSNKNAWCLNGVIYVKLGDVVHRINCEKDLQNLKK